MKRAEVAELIMSHMLPFHVFVTPVDGPDGNYYRVRNHYTGSIMGPFNKKLEEVAKRFGMKVRRVRTLGNGMTSAADWEDRFYSEQQ
jgi:hypothetical protein